MGECILELLFYPLIFIKFALFAELQDFFTKLRLQLQPGESNFCIFLLHFVLLNEKICRNKGKVLLD